ncbi:MAG: sodium:proton antiporter NhaD [Methylococcaceae bacterium]|nr:sodium:proton antiporter NhaD [Methylococcaceae bacterium]
MTRKSCAWLLLSLPEFAVAEEIEVLGATGTPTGIYCLLIFMIAYAFVMVEEFTKLRKSKPVILAAGIIWALVAYLANDLGVPQERTHAALISNLIEYGQLFLFLLVAMTYVNAMTERHVFEALRSWLMRKNFSYRQLFLVTGVIAFFVSAVADNLTTALLIGTVVMAVGKNNPVFVSMGLVNVVVAANAGGAFSPFGDITTLMVWQSGKAGFFDFFDLFIPSAVNYGVPAAIMYLAIPDEVPRSDAGREVVRLKHGAIEICLLFALTIVVAVSFENFLHIPPFLGMMTGLGILMIYGYRIKTVIPGEHDFDIFNKIRDAEWDTLMFFFGVVFAVGGLGYIGYLKLLSAAMYGGLGPTAANILVGLLSAIIDNIPVVFAVLSMSPDMDLYQWLLITLTAGVGGSLLSIGSAAGVALMGQSKGLYTFFTHLRWTPVIAAGYFASILAHYLMNG